LEIFASQLLSDKNIKLKLILISNSNNILYAKSVPLRRAAAAAAAASTTNTANTSYLPAICFDIRRRKTYCVDKVARM